MNQNKFEFIVLRDIPHEFIITMGTGIKDTDLQLFFQFKKSDIIPEISLVHHVHFDQEISWEDLAVIFNHMPSKSQARKNGWNGKVPHGYTESKKSFIDFIF